MEFRPMINPLGSARCGLRFGQKKGGVVLLGFVMTLVCIGVTAGCNSSSHAAPNAITSATVPSVPVVKVSQRAVNFAVSLPGELQPYEAVAVYPKVTGFVKSISVDRGSRVVEGQVLAQLEAPELVSQKSEAEAKLASAENQQTEAEAKLAKDQDSFQRLKVAAATPGVISENELEIAQKSVEADAARVVGLRNAVEAAKANVHSAEVMESYLRIRAPFTGIVTERNVHPGALVGPAGGGNAQVPMLRIEQISSLRLVVAVPEAYTAGVIPGAKVNFSVPAFPNRTFIGTVARVSDSLDTKTRTMPVELDVKNADSLLAPGMFPSVSWPVRRPQSSLIVPQSALLRSMQGTFVIRVRNGITEWVTVKPGVNMGNDVEVFGELHAGDEVVLQASEELPPNTKVSAHLGAVSGG